LHAGWLRVQTDIQNIILTAFPLQQWLRERSSALPYTHLARLVEFNFRFWDAIGTKEVSSSWKAPNFIPLFYYKYTENIIKLSLLRESYEWIHQSPSIFFTAVSLCSDRFIHVPFCCTQRDYGRLTELNKDFRSCLLLMLILVYVFSIYCYTCPVTCQADTEGR